MGCHVSKGSATRATHPDLTATTPLIIRVLVVGEANSGRSAFARRFVDRTFLADATPFVQGRRDISVNGARVTIVTTNVAHATAQDLAHVDAVMYTVRGDDEDPFRHIYRYADVLHTTSAAEAAGVMVSAPLSPRSAPGSRDMIEALPQAHVGGKLGGNGASSQSLSILSSREPSPGVSGASPFCSNATPASSGAGPGAGAGAGADSGEVAAAPGPASLDQGRVSSGLRPQLQHQRSRSVDEGLRQEADAPGPAPLGQGPRLQHQRSRSADERLPAPLGLRVDTGRIGVARVGSNFRHRHRAPTPLAERPKSTVPMAVVVTMCDVLDARADTDPQSLLRLRAMAANWSSANRMRVTFVSSQTGVGVNSAMAHLIKLAYMRVVPE